MDSSPDHSATSTPKVWVLKTTSHGVLEKDHWPEFLEEKSVGIGFVRFTENPKEYTNWRDYLKATFPDEMKNRSSQHEARTIFRFAKEWHEGDIVIVCRGYCSQQGKPVHLYGIAKVGSFRWGPGLWGHGTWTAKIMPIEKCIPVDILKTVFGRRTMLQTIHGPLKEDVLARLAVDLTARLPKTWPDIARELGFSLVLLTSPSPR